MVIGITETWLKQEIKDVEINLQGYEVFICDRKEGAGRVHESFKSSSCEQLDNMEFENAVRRNVKLNGNDSLLIRVICRSDIENNEKLLEAMRSMMKLNNISHYLIMGDFNVPEVKWGDLYVQGDSD